VGGRGVGESTRWRDLAMLGLQSIMSGQHRWAPGVSGNPDGRPPVSLSLADAIRRRFSPERIVDHAERLLTMAEEQADVRAAAIVLQLLTDRGYGKVLTTVEVTGRRPEAVLDLTGKTRDEKIAMERALASIEAEAVEEDVDATPSDS
jgi:hypothetical protein